MKKQDHGFTLLELAITMTVVGVMMIFAIQAYSKYRTEEVRRITVENVKNANTKVTEFLRQHARYPCPGALAVERDNVNYGLEGDCAIPVVSDGNCDAASGICAEQGARAIPTLGRPTVRRGALPFRALNMPEEMAYDGYGNRIQYAVTEILAEAATYNPNHGTIEIVDSNDVTVLKQPATAQFIVFSSGENAVGAYTVEGVRTDTCSGATNDAENCNTAPSNRQAVYRAMVHDRTAANYYDDVVAYDTASEAPSWKFVDDTSTNAKQVEDDNVLVLFDTTDTPTNARLEVSGDMRVDGKVQTIRYCTETVDSATPTNEECFESDKLAGDIASGAGMECPAGTILTGIRNSAPICTPTLALGSCPDGELLRGVDADHQPICDAPPVTCGPYTVNHCGDTYTFPTSAHGTVLTSDRMGYSYYRRLRCNGGSWQSDGSWGYCSCNPGTYTQNYSCGTGYTGRRYRDVTTVCESWGPHRTYGSWDRSDCSCVGATRTRTQNCPSDMAGNLTRIDTFVCGSGGSPDEWVEGTWSSVADSCTCVPRAPQERTVSCTNGETGSRVEVKNYLCPAAVWDTNWVEDPSRSSCTCVPGTKQYKEASDCPSGQIGTVYYERETACDQPGGGWGPWTEISNTCRPQTCVWRPVGTSTPGSFGIGAGGVSDLCTCGRANTACYLQKGANSYDNYSECSCELQ